MSEKQIKSAAAVGLISLSGFGSVNYFNAGRAVQRMWLTASEVGIAIHPMTALAYFLARLVRGGGQGFTERTIADLHDLRRRLGASFQLTPWAAEVFLFRIGYGDAAAKRSLRRTFDEVLLYR